MDFTLPVEVRYLSIIQLKNGIDKYWRKTASKYAWDLENYLGYQLINSSSAIKLEEKLRIKTRALETGVIEPDRHLALHNALMIAKIMRYEFPLDW